MTPEQRILMACERPHSFLVLCAKLRLPERIVEATIAVLVEAGELRLSDGWRYTRTKAGARQWTNYDERLLLAGLDAGETMRRAAARIGRSPQAARRFLNDRA